MLKVLLEVLEYVVLMALVGGGLLYVAGLGVLVSRRMNVVLVEGSNVRPVVHTDEGFIGFADDGELLVGLKHLLPVALYGELIILINKFGVVSGEVLPLIAFYKSGVHTVGTCQCSL